MIPQGLVRILYEAFRCEPRKHAIFRNSTALGTNFRAICGLYKVLPIAGLVLWLASVILAGFPGGDARAESLGSPSSAARMSAPERDVNRPGSDYRNFPVDDGWQACASQCAAEESCWSWTFVNPSAAGGAGRCWLKSVVAAPRRDGCCISGVKELEGAAATGRGALVGRWRWFNGATVDCGADGTCSATNGYSGSWKWLDGEGRFEIRWARGGQPAQFVDTLKVSPDGIRLSGTNQSGSGVGARRMAAAPPVLPDRRAKTFAPAGSVAARGDLVRQDRAAEGVSAAQADVLKKRGPPDTFLIMFLALETAAGGEGLMRQEYWRYYGDREEVVFVDGALVARADLEPLPAGYKLPGYSPAGFQPDMSFAEVAELLDISSFVKEEIPDEEGDMAELYRAKQIALGFSNGELVYVESMPARVQGGAQ